MYSRAHTNFGTYKRGSNSFETDKFKFCLNTCQAFSYRWWQFVVKVGNTIYFNDASYSMQTRGHQTMGWNILAAEMPEKHGIKVVSVFYKEGLNHLDRAILNMDYEINKLRELINKPGTHKAKNNERRERIKALKARIIETRALDRKIQRQYKINDEIERKISEANRERDDLAYERLMKRRELARMRAERERINTPAPIQYDLTNVIQFRGAK